MHHKFKDGSATLLSEPQILTNFDFNHTQMAECMIENQFLVENNGVCHAWLGWFSIYLGGHWLGTGPSDLEVHWGQVCMLLKEPQLLQKRGGGFVCK
jgi:hypothetical protein